MKIKLDDLQFNIMKVLWKKGQASVSSVRDALKAEKNLAITTIGTVLSRLEKKNLVEHTKEGRQYIYRPLITEGQARNSMTSRLINQLFKGDPGFLINHLINQNDFEEDELSELEQKIQEYKESKRKN